MSGAGTEEVPWASAVVVVTVSDSNNDLECVRKFVRGISAPDADPADCCVDVDEVRQYKNRRGEQCTELYLFRPQTPKP